MTSSRSWKATPAFSPKVKIGGLELGRAVAEDHARLGGGRDQRAGLVGEHLQVELDRILVRPRPDRLVHLPEHESLEGVGLQPDGTVAVAGHDLARAGEEQVAGEDRDVVAPHRVGAGHAATLVRGIHHVVVVERSEMGQLEGRGTVDDRVGRAVAELRGEEREHGPDPLAARLVEVAARGVGEGVGDAAAHARSFSSTRSRPASTVASSRRDRGPAKMRSVRPSLLASREPGAEGVTVTAYRAGLRARWQGDDAEREVAVRDIRPPRLADPAPRASR